MHYQDIEIEIYSDPINQKRYKPYTTGSLTIVLPLIKHMFGL